MKSEQEWAKEANNTGATIPPDTNIEYDKKVHAFIRAIQADAIHWAALQVGIQRIQTKDPVVRELAFALSRKAESLETYQ